MGTPGFVAPCQPVLVRQPPQGEGWAHEIKHDGYRVICAADGEDMHIYTRGGHDWTARMPQIADALARLKLRQALIDGEAVIFGVDGIADFFPLHAALMAGAAPAATLVAFDLLTLGGEDLRSLPWEERRARLAGALVKRRFSAGAIEISEEIGGEGQAAFTGACAAGLEGIVSKRRNSPYRSGTFDAWRKAKCTTTEPFAVLGGDPARGAVRSLAVARLVDGELLPCGNAGSGLTEVDGLAIRAALDGGKPVVASIEHRGYTPAGELRHPVVRGWQAG